MKILYITQFFYPEITAGAFRAYDNARIWSKNGNDVTVFTVFPNYPAGEIFDGYQIKMFQEETIDAIRVLRSKILINKNKSLLRRIVNAGSFFFFGIINFIVHHKKIGKDYNVVLGSSGPIFAALLAWIFAVIFRLPFVFEIRDITYRQLIATGKTGSSLSVHLMRCLELFLCRRARQVVVVTNGFKQVLVQDGIDQQKIMVITNGADVAENMSLQKSDDTFCLSYFGTLGISQRIDETFLYAEEMAKQIPGFTYQMIGEGAQREIIEERLRSGRYPYIQLLHGVTRRELDDYYGKTELSIVKLAKSKDFRYTLPSKLFQIMGHGVAVLFIGPEGEASEIVRHYHTGIALCGTPQEDVKALQEWLQQSNWRQKLHQMGANGYNAVRDFYDRKELAIKYLDMLKSIAR